MALAALANFVLAAIIICVMAANSVTSYTDTIKGMRQRHTELFTLYSGNVASSSTIILDTQYLKVFIEEMAPVIWATRHSTCPESAYKESLVNEFINLFYSLRDITTKNFEISIDVIERLAAYVLLLVKQMEGYAPDFYKSLASGSPTIDITISNLQQRMNSNAKASKST